MAGGGSFTGRPRNNKALSESQELAICEYIDLLDSWEMSARPAMIEGAANYLLWKDGCDWVVEPQWTRRFLDRHPEYLKRKQKPLAVERKNAHNIEDILEYFETYRKLVEVFG